MLWSFCKYLKLNLRFRNFHTVLRKSYFYGTQCEKTRNSLSQKNISSNQLFSNLFSKTVTFTKFLPKMCLCNFHTVRNSCDNSMKNFRETISLFGTKVPDLWYMLGWKNFMKLFLCNIIMAFKMLIFREIKPWHS